MQSRRPPQVFISYSHKDAACKDELVKQLRVLEQAQLISSWHDGELTAGQRWNDEIIRHLNSAHIILLIVSPDFVVSSYINEVEMKLASERRKAEGVVVIPVLYRNVNSWGRIPFGDIQLGDLHALPSKQRFIEQWPRPADAYANVSRGIEHAAEKIKQLQAEETSPAVAPAEPLPTRVASYLPRPPRIGFIRRQDRQGRDIVERLRELLAPEKNNVVGLSGRGGVGKTTIAAEAAHALFNDFRGRVVWSSPEPRARFDFSTFLDDIATQLGRPELRKLDVRQREEQVRALVASAPTLIVLDNFESVIIREKQMYERFLISEQMSPALIVSRTDINDTIIIPITGMTLEEATLFMQRLVEQTHEPHIFTDQLRLRIIQTANYNPFIMKWVVGQIDEEAHRPDQVLSAIEEGNDEFLQDRVFNRSWEALDKDGRAVLYSSSLFVQGATRTALAEVAGLGRTPARFNEAVKQLRKLWLLNLTGSGEDSYRLSLEDLTRRLTKRRLIRDKTAIIYRQRFVKYYLAYAEAHAQKTRADFNALASEKDNLLNAIDTAYDLKVWESVMRIIKAIAFPGMLDIYGYWGEAIRGGLQALEAARYLSDKRGVAEFAQRVGVIYQRRGDFDEARQLYDESLKIHQELNYEKGIAAVMHQQGKLALVQGHLNEAYDHYNQSLSIFRQLGERAHIATILNNLGKLEQDRGHLAEAQRYYDESLAIRESLDDQKGIASTLVNLGWLKQNQGDFAEAHHFFERSMKISKALGDKAAIASTSLRLAWFAQRQGEMLEAKRLCGVSLAISRELGDQMGTAHALHQLALLTQDQARTPAEVAKACRLHDQCMEIAERLGDQSLIADTKHNRARIAQDQGDLSTARRLYEESRVIKETLGDPLGLAITLHELGRLLLEEGRLEEARQHFEASLELEKSVNNLNGIARELHQFGRMAHARGDLAEARRLYQESLEMQTRVNDKSGIASTRHQLGLLNEQEGRHDQAIHLLRSALHLFEELRSRFADEVRRDLQRVETAHSDAQPTP